MKMKHNYTIFIILTILLFVSCMDDTYDLSNGINNTMTIGGDSLTIPLMDTKRVSLDSMLTKQEIAMLQQMDDSTYSFRLTDSMCVNMDYLSAVKFSFLPFTIAPVSSVFSTVKIPDFQFSPINVNTLLKMPEFSLDSRLIPQIEESCTQNFSVETSANKIALQQVKASKVKSELYGVGPLGRNLDRTIGESIDFEFPKELKKINKVKFADCKVTLTFDKTKTNLMGFTSQNDTIRNFTINFPSEFNLSTPVGMKSRIQGHSFIIDHAALTPNVNVFTATFIIKDLDLSLIAQNGSIHYEKKIDYNLEYVFWGQIDNLFSLLGKDVEYTVALRATPIIDDADIVTNTLPIEAFNGRIEFEKTIENIPTEISEIKTISFENGAELILNVNDPGLTPFQLSSGICRINLPKSMIFKPFAGLNLSTNELTIPYADLFKSKALAISGMALNKTVLPGNKTITIKDQLSYSFSDFKLGEKATSLKTISSLSDKLLNVTVISNNLVVKNADLITRRITIDFPQKTTEIKISKYVSTSLKKIYTAGLVSPVQSTFSIQLSNLPSTIDSVFFENYTIKLPKCLKFSNSNLNSNNELVLNEGFKVSKGFTKTLILDGFDFGSTGILIENGVFNLNEAITLSGKVFIKGSNINTGDLGTVTIKPAIQIGEMNLAVIQAEISPQLASINKKLQLNFPEFLKGDSSKLDLQNPVISLEIGNTFGAEVEAKITIIPKRNGQIIPNASISCTINIAAAKVLGTPTVSKFRLSKLIDLSGTSITQIAIPDLPKFLKILPDDIEIIVTPTLMGNKQSVDLSSLNNKMNIKYDVEIPLDFGESFNIQFNDTISNLKQQLAELIKYTSKIELVMDVANKIPVNFNMELIPMDENKNEISGLNVISNDELKSCNVDGSAQKSTLLLTINEEVSGSLKHLDSFKIKISATKNNTIAGLALRSNQYFEFALKLRIPEGITLAQNP